eukprot:m.490957 g.490957  ORF g.490957 m.490957 type:complete len:66 (-) comp57255_c0_seq21:93-290(-)
MLSLSPSLSDTNTAFDAALADAILSETNSFVMVTRSSAQSTLHSPKQRPHLSTQCFLILLLYFWF